MISGIYNQQFPKLMTFDIDKVLYNCIVYLNMIKVRTLILLQFSLQQHSTQKQQS